MVLLINMTAVLVAKLQGVPTHLLGIVSIDRYAGLQTR